jgi:hypothetical protein
MTKLINPTVLVDLVGGLGNQLFQFAAGSVLSDKFEGNLVLNCRGIKSNHDGVGLTEILPSQVKKIKEQNYIYEKVYRKIMNREPVSRQLKMYKKTCKNYKEELGEKYPSKILDFIPSNLHIQGYFQSYVIVEAFKKILNLNLESNKPEITTLISKIVNEKPIVFHIRRGDYLNYTKSFGILDLKYYENAYEILKDNTKDKIIVFTDSETLVNDELTRSLLKRKIEIVKTNKSISSWHYMVAMSFASKIVNSNSTFSWWASSISKAEMIISPSAYYRNSSVEASNNLEIHYPHWLKLEPVWSTKYDVF